MAETFVSFGDEGEAKPELAFYGSTAQWDSGAAAAAGGAPA